METSGNFSRTLEGGHEPFYEYPCSLCEGEGRHVEAAKYCEECLVYLCGYCLLDKHNKFPLNTRHRLLDQSQFSTVNKSAIVSFSTKRCLKHPGELINTFCGNHDVVCCSVCKALEHSSCVKTQHLPDAAKGIHRSEECKSIKTGTRALISDLDKVLNDRKSDISRIAKERQHVRQTIADFRKKVNKYFDDLEKNTLEELDHREKTTIHGIDQDKNFLETAKSNADDILKQLDSFKGDNECDLFVQVKTGLHFLNEGVKKLRDICTTNEKSFIHFEINRSIEEYISSLKTLGAFSNSHAGTSQSVLSSVSNVTSSVPLVSPKGSIHDHAVQSSTYKARLCGKYDIEEKSDDQTCYIKDLCQMPDETFLIVDWKNDKIKRLDKSFKLLDSVQLSDEPHCVCAAGPGEAAVSVFFKQKIQFVSLGNKLRLTRSFTVGNRCKGIVYIDNELFVCCGRALDFTSHCIEVYNNAGKLQRSIPRVPQRLSSLPWYITASDDGQHLLVTSWDNDDIAMLDLIGNVVNTFSHKDLTGTIGLCTDGRGHVFVCGSKSNTVVQLSPIHHSIEVILSKSDGIEIPQGVCYDRGRSRLLVSCSNSNQVLVFTLE